MSLKSYVFLIIICFKYVDILAVSDSLDTGKSYFEVPIYTGISFGKNENTYQNGGRIVVGVGIYYHKNSLFWGADMLRTSFKDINEPDFKVGNWIKIKATKKVYTFSANIGKTFGDKQNLSLSGGLGYISYRNPIVDSRDGLLFSSYYKIVDYEVSNSFCINTSFKAYFDLHYLPKFVNISASLNKQINFFSFGIGFDLNHTKKGFIR